MFKMAHPMLAAVEKRAAKARMMVAMDAIALATEQLHLVTEQFVMYYGGRDVFINAYDREYIRVQIMNESVSVAELLPDRQHVVYHREHILTEAEKCHDNLINIVVEMIVVMHRIWQRDGEDANAAEDADADDD
jgi:hypothetical protein